MEGETAYEVPDKAPLLRSPAQPSRKGTVSSPGSSSDSLTFGPRMILRGSLPGYCEAGFLRGGSKSTFLLLAVILQRAMQMKCRSFFVWKVEPKGRKRDG
jgi:hypothetical protein